MIAGQRWLVAALATAALWQIGAAGWIHLKAGLAQVLLERAWAETLAGGDARRPWPWADTWPAARLTVERLGVDLVALEGFSGQALAFGPGVGAAPDGSMMMAGHRDTHFRFLDGIRLEERVTVTRADGRGRRFRVAETRVVDRADAAALDAGGEALWLVTCWPFDALTPRGPLRFVVRADPDGPWGDAAHRQGPKWTP